MGDGRNREPDYAYWGKLDVWSIDEFVALILQRSPESIRWDDARSDISIVAFAREYARIREMAMRSTSLYWPAVPNPRYSSKILLEWAKIKELSIPPALEAAVSKYSGDIVDWRSAHSDLSRQLQQQRDLVEQRDAKIAELESTIRALRDGPPYWPWGSHTTPHLGALAGAGKRFWGTDYYDPADPTTAPTNPMVVKWLRECHPDISNSMAESMATILRDPQVKTGPRPK